MIKHGDDQQATAAGCLSHDKVSRYRSHQHRHYIDDLGQCNMVLKHTFSQAREFRVSCLPSRGRVVDRRWQRTFSSAERMDARMNPARCLARRHPYRHGWHVDVDSLIFRLNHSGMYRLLAHVECITAAPHLLRESGREVCCVSYQPKFLSLRSNHLIYSCSYITCC